jgi:hypothetical protein
MKLGTIRLFEVDNPLRKFASNVSSQDGEDGIIEHILSVLQPEHRYCVEFGAWDGKYCSNAHHLLRNGGWSGVMIEANAGKFKDLQVTYADKPAVTCLNRFVQFDSPGTLDDILDELKAPQSPGMVSIDIDGNDYYIWESMQRYTPELIVIEFNPTVPNDVYFVQDRDTKVNHGCSLLALIMLGREKGYELVCCSSWNAFFVKKEKYPLFGIKDNMIYKMYQPLQDGRIFQGYDSFIHVVGMDRLIWRGGAQVNSLNFQILPEEQRVWGDAQSH